MKRHPLGIVLVVALALQGHAITRADEPVPPRLQDGISLRVGETQVELRVGSPHAFCLGVHAPAAESLPRSIYLCEPTGTAAGTPFQVFHEGAAVGIETSFGKLLVDPARRRWSLRDPAGKVLADWATLGLPASETPQTFEVSVGANPATPHPLYYGSGTVPNRGALTQSEGKGKTGNGVTTLPQYWSTAGYGVLVIGSDDNEPGVWKADDSGAVNWKIPGHGMDIYLCPAPDLYSWLRAQAELTGFAPVPPLWSFGYMQSRWGWKDKAYIDDTLAHFRRDQLPVDTFIIDFEWYTTKPDYGVKTAGEADYADFNWNPRLFPDPATQAREMARQGVHLVGIRKPRLGNSENLKMAGSKGWVLPAAHAESDGSTPLTRDLDYSKPEVRAWWGLNNRRFLEDGMSAFWNDEGELRFTEYSYWNMAEVALQRQVNPGKRFWSLNRSYIPGLQRFGAAVWTGDYDGTWQTLARQPGEMLSYSVSGMPYTTCDIGGMDNELSPELYTRWMQAAVFFPVMRAHSGSTVTPHFPWNYGPEAEAAARKALNLRYRLIPYYDSLAHENSMTAAPLMRPLAMEFPGDEKTATLTDEWLLGKGLLTAPLLNEGGSRTVYLPKDRWFHFDSTRATEGPQSVQITAGLDEIPLYVRAGTLLPLGPVRQSTGQASADPLELQVYAGRDAVLDFVEDGGENRADSADARHVTSFSWNEQGQTLTWKVSGGYEDAGTFRSLKVVCYSPQGRVEKQTGLGHDGSLTMTAQP